MRKSTEAATGHALQKKVFLKISQISQENTCVVGVSLNKVAELRTQKTNVFSCEYCKIFKKSLFYRTPPVTASESMKDFFHTKRIRL